MQKEKKSKKDIAAEQNLSLAAMAASEDASGNRGRADYLMSLARKIDANPDSILPDTELKEMKAAVKDDVTQRGLGALGTSKAPKILKTQTPISPLTGEGWERDADGIVTYNGRINSRTIAVEKGFENLRREEDYARDHPYNSRAQARVRHIRNNLPKFR